MQTPPKPANEILNSIDRTLAILGLGLILVVIGAVTVFNIRLKDQNGWLERAADAQERTVTALNRLAMAQERTADVLERSEKERQRYDEGNHK